MHRIVSRTLAVRLFMAAAMTAVVPSVARAQHAALATDAAAGSVPVVAPALTSVPAPQTAAEAPRSLTAAGQMALRVVRAEAAGAQGAPGMAPGKSFGEAEALMIVGGAALLGGILVGGRVGYVVSVVGLGVGLYGLWMYLR